MKLSRVPILLILTTVAFTACGDTEPGAGGSITGTTWQLTGGTVDGAAISPIDSAPVTITFGADGTVGGTSACNSYGGTAVVDGSDLSFPEPLFQTEMACLDEGVMDLEATYLGALARVTAFTVGADSLVMTGDSVELRFAVQPPEPDASLIGTEWSLETLQQGETASTPAAPATIAFGADGTVSGTTGCNGFGGSYDPGTGFGQMMSTLMACEQPVMDQEQLILSILTPQATVTIEGSTLTIADLEGNALIYRAG